MGKRIRISAGNAGKKSASGDAGWRPDRDGRKLLIALAQPGAAPARADLREGFLVVGAPRRGVTSIIANVPAGCAPPLLARGLLRRLASGGRETLALAPEGVALARRLAAPEATDAFARPPAEPVLRALAAGETAVLVNEAESPLSWLARRKGRDGAPYLGAAQVAAGERFRRDVETARLRPRVTCDWSGLPNSGERSGQGMHVSDVAVAARQRLERAAAAVGPDLEGVLVDICGFQKGLELVERERAWPPRSAKVVLRIALDRLASHYGIAGQATGPAHGRMRRWGAADYRPSMEGAG